MCEKKIDEAPNAREMMLIAAKKAQSYDQSVSASSEQESYKLNNFSQ